MGSYGIGPGRVMGTIAEHFADEKGLVWPENIAPAKVYLARLGNISDVISVADKLYNLLTDAGVEVIYDDRDLRAGEMFADADLMGIPYRVVVSQKTVESGKHELKGRSDDEVKMQSVEEIVKALAKA
jgi:prolyl-tRNA synthetase